jgi:hypothetical protein
MKLKTALLAAIIAIFLVMILAQIKPAHFKYQEKNTKLLIWTFMNAQEWRLISIMVMCWALRLFHLGIKNI